MNGFLLKSFGSAGTFIPPEESTQGFLDIIIESSPALLIWVIVMILSESVLLYDLKKNNTQTPSLMKFVWLFTVFYSGFIGLIIYWKTGRKQISKDTIWRRGFRSVAHCYSGCGTGEAVGVIIAVGVLALKSNILIAAATFFFAYLFGYALTVGPLLQDGVSLKKALYDAFYTETASITVMEIVAISADIILAEGATMGDVRFWNSLIISLSLGLLAAYPVNLLLIRMGVKEGMMNPKNM